MIATLTEVKKGSEKDMDLCLERKFVDHTFQVLVAIDSK